MTRRNSGRFGVEDPEFQHADPASATPSPPTPQGAPEIQKTFNSTTSGPNLNFVVPTETVKLPSRGDFYDSDSSLSGKSELEIKHMTAREEDILANPDYIQDGTVFDRLLRSVLVDKSVDPRDLLAGDKNALLIACRVTGYGPEYSITHPCEACGKVSEFAYSLDKTSEADTSIEGVEFDHDSRLFNFKLPKTELNVSIKLLNGHGEKYLDDQKERLNNLNLQHSPSVEFIRMVVERVEGVTDQTTINKMAEVLPAIDSRRIKTVYNTVMPGVTTMQKVTCPACAAESEREVHFSLGFFWPDA